MRLIFAAAFVLITSAFCKAETLEVHPAKPVATFATPDGWIASRTKRGVQFKTEDEDVYIWAETYKPNELKKVVAEHEDYWREQGVVINGRSLSEHAENGVSVQIVEEKATYDGDPTVLLYMEYDLGLASKSNILITYWASPEGHKAYAADVKSFIDSMQVTEK